jgi:hypothetical protein
MPDVNAEIPAPDKKKTEKVETVKFKNPTNHKVEIMLGGVAVSFKAKEVKELPAGTSIAANTKLIKV